ncbi:MAG: hypothetical protein AAF409_15320 [Pseudomonadota bacterium]
MSMHAAYDGVWSLAPLLVVVLMVACVPVQQPDRTVTPHFDFANIVRLTNHYEVAAGATNVPNVDLITFARCAMANHLKLKSDAHIKSVENRVKVTTRVGYNRGAQKDVTMKFAQAQAGEDGAISVADVIAKCVEKRIPVGVGGPYG